MRSDKVISMATRESTSPNPMPYLPQEIMSKIFLRLSVEDLLRSKSVCKFWLSLISSSDFVKNHLSESTSDPHFTHHRLLLSYMPTFGRRFELKSCSVHSLLNEPVNEIVEFAPPADHRGLNSNVSYCNGLIVLENDDDLLFWNPSTRQSRRLPKLNNTRVLYEFCCDDSDDDFKVFAISTPYNLKNKLAVYSSKSDSWRLIGDFVSDTLLYGAYLTNGTLHWHCSDRKHTTARSMTIVSLDVKTETYQEKVLQLPNCGLGEDNWSIRTFDQSLSLCVDKYEHTCVEFWVLKEFDVEESWEKLFTIPYLDTLRRDMYIHPICISMNGDILLHVHSTVVLYNSKERTYKDLISEFCYNHLHVFTYVESLVSPHLKQLANESVTGENLEHQQADLRTSGGNIIEEVKNTADTHEMLKEVAEKESEADELIIPLNGLRKSRRKTREPTWLKDYYKD